MTLWKLVFIDSEGDLRSYTPGTVEECFANLPAIMQDAEMENNAREDLSRIGARYHEFVGGTLVLAAMF